MSFLEITSEQRFALVCEMQCLSSGASSPRRVLERSGYIRALGGVDVYLALKARQTEVTRAEIDRAVEKMEIQVVPTVRGCI